MKTVGIAVPVGKDSLLPKGRTESWSTILE